MPVPGYAKTLSAKAETALGDNYYNGTGGTKQDYAKAVYWFKKAAAQGSATSKRNLSIIEKQH